MKALLLAVILCPALLLAQKDSPRLTPLVRTVNKVMPATVILSSRSIDIVNVENLESKLKLDIKNLGTGIIVDESGLLLTNEHVIRGLEIVRVSTFNNRQFDASVLFTSKKDDLAILKIDNPDGVKFKTVKFAWPRDLYLGEPVVTIGSPLGLNFSISKGILSATQRKLEVGERLLYDNLLQTDIKVNPGNSGGPLVNMDGRIIGLMVGSQTDSYGIGFAIPVEKIEKILLRWFSTENQVDSTIGFNAVTVFDRKKKKARVVVKNVEKNRLNYQFGIRNDMVINKIESRKVESALDFYRYLTQAQTGQQLELTLADGRKMNMELFPLQGLTLAKARLGLEFQKLGPDIARAMSLPFDSGFVLSNIDNRYKGVKIQRGDMLFKIGNKIIMKDDDFQSLFATLESGIDLDVVFLRVNFEGGMSKVEVINDRLPLSLIQ